MIEVSEKRFDEQIASRDAEIATLREQVKMLRDALEYANVRIGFSSYEAYKTWTEKVESILKATEPKA